MGTESDRAQRFMEEEAQARAAESDARSREWREGRPPQPKRIRPGSFEGRVGRVQFALEVLPAFALLALAYAVAGAYEQYWWAVLAVLPAVFWLGLAAIVKRSHDMGLSGWHALIGYVPVINLLWFCVLLLWPGNKKENEYG